MNKLHFFLLALMLIISYGCDSETIEDLEPRPEPYKPLVETLGKYPIIAHRGSWSQNGYPQNSLAALREALDLDLFGSECDVWKTKDNVIVINHDKTYNGLDITKSTYEELSQYLLANGERLPTLNEFLNEVCMSATNTKLVIELKSDASIESVFALVSQYNMFDKVLFISYSFKRCRALVEKGYGYITYYIGHDRTPKEIYNSGLGGFYCLETLIRQTPEWIEQSKELGIQLVLGSVTSPVIMNNYIEHGCLFSSNKPIMLVQAIDSQANNR